MANEAEEWGEQRTVNVPGDENTAESLEGSLGSIGKLTVRGRSRL